MKRDHRLPHTAAIVYAVLAIVATDVAQALAADTWRGLVVAPEHRCAPYVAAIHMLRPGGPRCSIWC